VQPEPQSRNQIPLETAQAAKNLFNVHHIYLQIGDHLDAIIADVRVSLLDPSLRYDDTSVVRLALTSAFQMAEGLSDAQAARMTIERLDWKYALYLPVKHPGFSEQEICNFRRGVLSSAKSMEEYSVLLQGLKKFGLFPRSTAPLLDAQTGLTQVCQITRLYALDQAIKNALGVLVSQAPEWLLLHVSPHWYERYSSRPFNPGSRATPSDLIAEGERFGIDIQHLLNAIQQEDSLHLAQHQEIKSLIRIYAIQYAGEGKDLRWLPVDCTHCILYDSVTGSARIN
jgi:hypothetical protein